MFMCTLLAEKSADPFPILDNIWSIFARKGNKTVFLSVGASATALPDLELAETLGCPLHVVPVGASQAAAWAEVGATLKARAAPADPLYPAFSGGAEEKWILPKNFRVVETLPWWSAGTVDLSGVEGSVRTEGFLDVAIKVCNAMGISPRIDILKVDVPAEAERGIIMSLLEHNLRPAIVLVNWSHRPDEHVQTTITAGHLQNSGYMLVSTVGNKFCYFFVDQDVYMSCSWEDTKVANPLVKQIVDMVQKSKSKPEGATNHAGSATAPVAPVLSEQTETVPSGGAAIPESSDTAPTGGA